MSATHPRGEGTLDALLAAGKLVHSKRGLNEIVEPTAKANRLAVNAKPSSESDPALQPKNA